jgi:SAM-dependent methyltransferase
MNFEELSARYWGRRAKDYEAERAGSSSWMRENNAVDAYLGEIAEGGSVVDIPVGTGRFLELYAKHGLRPTGLDISDDMLAQAAAKARDLGLEIALRRSDIRAIEAPDASFDAALCIRFLNWVDSTGVRAAVAELARVSRSHVILGIRCYLPAGAGANGLSVWQSLRGAKKRLSRKMFGSALVVHDKQAAEALFAEHGLSIVESQGVNPRPDRSDYFIYLLRRDSQA